MSELADQRRQEYRDAMLEVAIAAERLIDDAGNIDPRNEYDLRWFGRAVLKFRDVRAAYLDAQEVTA